MLFLFLRHFAVTSCFIHRRADEIELLKLLSSDTDMAVTSLRGPHNQQSIVSLRLHKGTTRMDGDGCFSRSMTTQATRRRIITGTCNLKK